MKLDSREVTGRAKLSLSQSRRELDTWLVIITDPPPSVYPGSLAGKLTGIKNNDLSGIGISTINSDGMPVHSFHP